MNEIEYTKGLWEKVKKVCDYYENHDTIAFLRRIMVFVDECIDLIDEPLFLVSKAKVNDFRNRARNIWIESGSAEKLELLLKEYNQLVDSVKPFEKLLKMRSEYAACRAVGWYLSNYHDDSTSQFTHDFMELFIGELQKTGVAEEKIDEKLNQHFKDIIDA